MTYNLDTWQYACIEDDYVSIYFGFGKREFFESKDLCFSNEDYIGEPEEPPFVVNNNCYGPWVDDNRFYEEFYGEIGTTVSGRPENNPRRDPFNMFHEPSYNNPFDDPDWSYWTCHDLGYRVDLHVIDNADANLFYDKTAKIREDSMWVQVGFHRVKDYFQIFPEDKAKISFWKGQDEAPSSVVISPFENVENICEPDRAADEIVCENMAIFCEDASETFSLRIAAAGE